MKYCFQIVLFLAFMSFACHEAKPKIPQAIEINSSENGRPFELTFIRAGLGSNLNSKQPTFRITEGHFLYTLEENSSWDGRITQKPDTICHGTFRQSSIDSIGQIVKGINQDSIYVASDIMSGAVDRMLIVNEGKKIKMTLHNETHPAAQAIVEIINANIPVQLEKIKLWTN